MTEHPHDNDRSSPGGPREPDRPTEEAGLNDRAEEFIADLDPTDQRGRPVMITAFMVGIVLALCALALVYWMAR